MASNESYFAGPFGVYLPGTLYGIAAADQAIERRGYGDAGRIERAAGTLFTLVCAQESGKAKGVRWFANGDSEERGHSISLFGSGSDRKDDVKRRALPDGAFGPDGSLMRFNDLSHNR